MVRNLVITREQREDSSGRLTSTLRRSRFLHRSGYLDHLFASFRCRSTLHTASDANSLDDQMGAACRGALASSGVVPSFANRSMEIARASNTPRPSEY